MADKQHELPLKYLDRRVVERYVKKGLVDEKEYARLLKTLPDTLERQRQELAFQTRLGPALMASRGYAAPEVKQAYIRAQELCEHVGDTPRLFSVLWGLWLFSLAR